MLKFSGSSCLISGPICYKNWIQDSFQDHHTNMLSHIVITMQHQTQHSLHKHISTDSLSPKQSPSSRLQQQNVTTLHSHTQYTYSSCHYSIYMHVHTLLQYAVRTQTSESAKKWFLLCSIHNHSCELCQQTLKQACFQEYPEAQFAFKNLMIHIFCNSHYVSHFAAFFIVART